jgi:hypothetical protein
MALQLLTSSNGCYCNMYPQSNGLGHALLFFTPSHCCQHDAIIMMIRPSDPIMRVPALVTQCRLTL